MKRPNNSFDREVEEIDDIVNIFAVRPILMLENIDDINLAINVE